MSATPDRSPEVGRADADWIGRVVDGRYRVEEHLGQGGMGAVFIAEHLKLHKQVALKIIHPEFAGDGEVAARFAREAMASAQLEHPHVASALDYGTLPEGGAYLVMQLVRGQSLQELITKGAQKWPRACEIAAQVADALAAAHAKEIVHRDLKPENVLLEPRDDGSVLVKVLDFGIARVATVEGRSAPEGAALGRALTRVGTVMGTPGYMAPEQAMGENVDASADLYSLGVVLWEMIAGRSMFATRDLTAIVTHQLTIEPERLRDVVGPEVPEELDDLISSMLARSPSDRPSSTSAVRDRLRALAFGASVSLGPAAPAADGRARTVLAADTGSTPAGAARSTARPATDVLPRAGPLARLAAAVEERPKPWLGGLAGGALLLVVSVIGIAALNDDETDGEIHNGAPPGQSGGGFSPGQVVEDIGAALAPEDPVLPEVQEKIDVLVSGARNRQRTQAARWLLRREPESDVPEWALIAADLEVARRCEVRREALLRLADTGEEEALPVVMRIYHAPENGCGAFFRRYDCYDCLRDDLPDVIDDLGGEEPASTD